MDRAKSDMNLAQLTEDERQAILRVLKRDQALRNMEEKRLMYMKSELHMLKKRGALKPGLDNMCNGSRCARCLTPLGLLINTGADCFVCLKKVCRSCRQYNELAPTNTNPKQWACLVCSKQMELKAASGEWMEEYKNPKSKTGLESLDIVKQLVLSGGSTNAERSRAESFSNQAHVSHNISVRSAPDSRPKKDSPKFERRVQFLSGSQESSIMVKKTPGNSKLASPPVLKKRPLVRNTAVDLPNTADVSESSILSKTSKVHPEAQDRERLPVSPIFYNKCRSRRDSSSSVSTCSLSSSSVQGPSPVALRKNAHESPLDIELRNKRISDESFYDNSQSRRSPNNCQKFQTERMISDPGYERNFSRPNDSTSIKSRSLGSYDETHSLRILQPRSNNLTLGSVDNLSDTTSNAPSEYSGPPSICSTYPSRPSSISPATFRRVLVSTLKDSSSSHSESEIEPSQPQFRKVSIKKNSLTEVAMEAEIRVDKIGDVSEDQDRVCSSEFNDSSHRGVIDGNRVVADCIRNLFLMDHSSGKECSKDPGVSLEKYYTEAIGHDQSGPESHSSTCSDRTNCDTDSWGESKYDEGLVEYPDDSSSLEGNDSSSESSEDTVYVPQIPNQHLPYLNPALYALHTIMEESCEESDKESENEENPSKHLPSQLEKYFSLAFVSDLEQKEVLAGRIPFDKDRNAEESSPTSTKFGKEEEKESLALMASSRLEKYFTSGLLEGSSVSYPPEFPGVSENVNVAKTEESNGICHFEQENSDTVKRRKAGESIDDPLLDLRNLFGDFEDVESVEEMQTFVPDEDNSCSYMLGKLMLHIKSSTQSNKNKLESPAEDMDALSLLESQISRLMQRVSPAHFANDEPSSTSSTCSSSTIGSTGNNSDCGSDTLESHEESTDEEGNLDADSFRITTHKKRSYLQHRSHSRHNELLNNLESTNISEETIYFCKQLVESLKRMSENNSPEGPKPPSLEATIEGLGVAAELTNARQYIKEQIESLMHSVTLSQQSSPASGRPHRPRRRAEAPSSSDAHDSSDVESPRPPNKKLTVSEKTPSESGSETTVSASISIPSYDDSDHTPTESEISHEMDELFTLLEGSSVSNAGCGVADYLPVPRILPPADSKNSSIHVSMNGSKLMEEKKTENVMNIISSFGMVEPSTSKCLVNSEVAGFNVFVPNVAQALEASKMKPYNSSLDSLDRDCLTPKAEVSEYSKNVNDSCLATQIPVSSSVQSSLSRTESKYSDSGSRETLVGSRVDLKETYASVVSGTRLFRSKMTYYSSTSEVDDEESLGRTEADSGVGTPVPNSLNSKEKASSENNLLLANYRATTKSNKVVDAKSTSKSASNIMELETSSENKGGSCRDTGYYSFKSSEESVRSLDDSLASRASSISLVFHKSLTSTETIPEVEEDSCSLNGATNDPPHETESSTKEETRTELTDTAKMSLSSGNIPDSVMVANPKSSTLPLNLRNKSHHLATNSLGSSHLRQRPFSSSFFSTSGVLRKLTALRDENAMAHRSSPRGRLRARGKALSTSSDDGINRASSGSVPQILISDHLENNSVRGSQSLSDRESIGLPEDDADQVISPYSRSQTSLFGARSESMSSVYSAAGGGRYGAVIVTGEILFSLNYNCKAGHLALHVKECRNLAPVDTKRNRSDPYVKVYLLPDKTKGGKRKTKVKKHTLNPIFDEVLKFVVTNSELETRTMWLSVWHSDIFGRNDFLGEVMLPLSSKLVDISQSLKWYPLQERMDANESTLSYKGDIILSLKFVPPDVTSKKPSRKTSTTSVAGTKGTLHVLVKEARNLMAIRSNGTSDPFCKSYLLPDKSKSGKQKTPVVKKSCNPKWNHTFVYEDISTEELKDRCLELTIWDYDKITSNDFLGGVRMNLGTGKHQGKDVDWMDALGEELVLWRSMVDRPNQWIDAALMLRPSMSRRS